MGTTIPTEAMLRKAKKRVIAAILRQYELSKTKQDAPLERAFYIATAEPTLFFDYDLMLKMVRDAKLVKFNKRIDPEWRDVMANTDPFTYKMMINKLEPT